MKSARADRAASSTAVFTGMFDPITLGHMDVIQRARGVFHRLIVGVGCNPDKSSLFSLEERVSLVKACVADLSGVSVASFEGLAVHFVRAQGAGVIVRGIRHVADLEYELTMARANRTLEASLETVFLAASESVSHISSALIRQIARAADRRELSQFVPPPVVDALIAKLQRT